MVSGTRQRRATSSAVENIRSVCSYCGVWSPGQQSEEVCTRQPVSCFGDYQMSRSEQTRRGQQPGEAQGMLFFSQENIRFRSGGNPNLEKSILYFNNPLMVMISGLGTYVLSKQLWKQQIYKQISRRADEQIIDCFVLAQFCL